MNARRTFMLLVVAGVAVLPAAGAAGGKARPNLVVTRVSAAPKTLSEGDRFAVSDTTANIGKGRAGRTTTRYYLSTDPGRSLRDREQSRTNPRTSPTDILLVGFRRVKPLGRGHSSRSPAGGVRVQVPGGTPTGRYHLLACADDRGAVRESRENDNCRASGSEIAVRAPASGSGRIHAFSDTVQPLPAAVEQQVPLLLRQACLPVKARRLSTRKAITSATRFLKSGAGANAYAAFKASPEYRTATAAEAAASEAMLSNSPRAALAALLRAHALQPREASHLVNAAGAADMLGLPNEALAFLNAALRLDDRDRPAMGIARQAVALANRGYALLQLGKYGQAERALSAALAIEPLLTEAQGTLAGVRACRGANPIPAFRRARRRQEPPKPPKLPVDDSQGKVTELRHFPFPALPENAYANQKFYEQLDDREHERSSANSQRRNALQLQLNRQLGKMSFLSQRRTLETLIVGTGVYRDPDLQALQDQYIDQIEASHRAREKLFGSGQDGGKYAVFQQQAIDACIGAKDPDTCVVKEIRARCIPAAKLTHQEWLNAATAAYRSMQAYQRLWSRRVSAVAAHLSNATAYQLLMLQVEVKDLGMISLLSQTARYWSGALRAHAGPDIPFCVDSPEPQSVTDTGEVEAKGAGPCPPGLKAVSVVVDLGVAKLKGNCEDIKLQASTKGWIQAFGEVKYNFRKGELTVFGGAKAEVGLGPLKGDWKSGVYVTATSTGFKDIGIRTGPSWTVGAGPAQVGKSDYMDFSFVAGLGTFGL
jgi:tetratricopeptide (TPR) repeat protein